jgi:hypothetical protein
VGRLGPTEQSAFEACHQRIVPGDDEYSVVYGHDCRERFTRCVEAFEAHRRFDAVTTRSFDQNVDYTRAEWLEHLETHSYYRTLEPSLKLRLFDNPGAVVDALGGSFNVAYETVCVTASYTLRAGR